MSKAPIRVAVTGAAGQIGYALLPRIASGQMFGPGQPVILQMIEIPAEKAMAALDGVAMELEDCAFPLLSDMVLTSDPAEGFKDVSWALLIGSKPRGPVTYHFSMRLRRLRQSSLRGFNAWPNWNCRLSTRRTLAGS